jgi:4-amino-4-deoxy-L-arabinose transferase-like glycosyltransferase
VAQAAAADAPSGADVAASAGAAYPAFLTNFAWLLSGIVLVGAILRLPTLGQQSLWTDEAQTYGVVAHGLGHLFSQISKMESTPPVYFLVGWVWARLFGLSEVALRLPSAIFGLATIVVVGQLGRRLVDARVGLAAALLTAVSPIMVWYSQEARAYAMVMLLSALSMLVLVWALERPNRVRLLLWSLSAAAALSVHYFAAFVIAPEAIWLGVALRRRGLLSADRVSCALGPVLVVAAALLPLLVHQADGRAAFIAQAQGSLPTRFVRLVKQDILGFAEPSKAAFSVLGGGLVVLSLALLARPAAAHQRRRLWLAIAVGAGGVFLAVLAAILGADYVNTRNMLPMWPALAIVVAGGLMTAGAGRSGTAGRAGLALLVVVAVACVVTVVVTPLDQRADWRGVAHSLGRYTGERAIVGDRLSLYSLPPYVSGLTRAPDTPVSVREVDVFALSLQSTPPPRPATAPVLPGFRLAARMDASTYTFLRYRARAPVEVSPPELRALGLMPGASNNVVLLQGAR